MEDFEKLKIIFLCKTVFFNILKRHAKTAKTHPFYVERESKDWKDINNQRSFFDQLAIKLNVKTPEDWSKVMHKTVLQEGGTFVNNYYKGSLLRGL
jgi:hypothetical protein